MIYQEASQAEVAENYTRAIELFLSLGSFMTARRGAGARNLETYQKASQAETNREYDTAYELFTGLGFFKDSAEQAKEVKSQKST